MRLKIVRLEMNDDTHPKLTLGEFEDMVNNQIREMEYNGFHIYDMDIDRFRNVITAYIKYGGAEYSELTKKLKRKFRWL